MQPHDLPDADAVVADPLELAHDREHRDDEAQIRGDGLRGRDEVDGVLLDRVAENGGCRPGTATSRPM